MKEINENNASEMLALYMDGELEPSLIPAFEEELAQNSALQTEYRELLAIREAVQKDVKKLVPPYETTATIFESLGISYTTSISSSTSVGMSIWQQILMPLVASFSAAVITFGTFLGIDNLRENDTNPDIVQQEQVIKNNSEDNLISNNNENIIETNSTAEEGNNNNISQQENNSTIAKKIIKKNTQINSEIINKNELNEKDIAANNEVIENELTTEETQNVIYEFFKIFENDIIQNDIKFVENGIGSKFNYNYNNQQFKDFGSVLHKSSITLGGSINQFRLGAEFNLSKYKLFSQTVNTIGINLGSNLFSDMKLLNSIEWNPNVSLEAKHEFYTLFSNVYPQLIAGLGYDFNSTSPFYRLGIGASTNLLNTPALIEFRYELNTLINPKDLQGLNYNLNNRGQGIINIKYKF